MMRLYDSHCHLDFPPFADDIDHHLMLARQQGVERVMVPTIGPQNWSTVMALCARHDMCSFAVGIHPYFLANIETSQALVALEPLLSQNHQACRAVGECGLDGVIDVPKSIQLPVFEQQVVFAKEHQLPLILHGRKAYPELLSVLKKYTFPWGGILHGFSGSYEQAQQFIEQGFLIGVGGTITYARAQKTRQAIQRLDCHCLVLETDAPDMPISGYQGRPNHPQYLPEILKTLSALKDIPLERLAEMLWINTNLIFNQSHG